MDIYHLCTHGDGTNTNLDRITKVYTSSYIYIYVCIHIHLLDIWIPNFHWCQIGSIHLKVYIHPAPNHFTPFQHCRDAFSASLRLDPLFFRNQTPTDEGLSEAGHLVDPTMGQNGHFANKNWKHDSNIMINHSILGHSIFKHPNFWALNRPSWRTNNYRPSSCSIFGLLLRAEKGSGTATFRFIKGNCTVFLFL